MEDDDVSGTTDQLLAERQRNLNTEIVHFQSKGCALTFLKVQLLLSLGE